MTNQNNSPSILLAEDDSDQLSLLNGIVFDQRNLLLKSEKFNKRQVDYLERLNVVEISDISALSLALSEEPNLIFAILDCNMPDTVDDQPHDQFLKDKHRITGQHNGVDLVLSYSKQIPITVISSLDRFRRLIPNFYSEMRGVSINFINKRDHDAIQRNIRYQLREHVQALV